MNAEMPDTARCLGCGCLLRGLAGTLCPECGRRFDPADPSTYGPRRRWRPARPPSLLECLACGLLATYVLLNARGPARWGSAWTWVLTFASVPFWLVLVAFYVVRLVAVLRHAVRAQGHPQDEQRTRSLRWVVLPLCVLLILSSFLYPWPLRVRFNLSRPAFDALLKGYEAGEFAPGQSVGLYYVYGAFERYPYERPGAVAFQTWSGFSENAGVVYDPNPGHPTGRGTVRVTPSWYTYGG
jgi:hypothetical protein